MFPGAVVDRAHRLRHSSVLDAVARQAAVVDGALPRPIDHVVVVFVAYPPPGARDERVGWIDRRIRVAWRELARLEDRLHAFWRWWFDDEPPAVLVVHRQREV